MSRMQIFKKLSREQDVDILQLSEWEFDILVELIEDHDDMDKLTFLALVEDLPRITVNPPSKCVKMTKVLYKINEMSE